MDWSILVATAGTIAGVIIGSLLTYVMDRDRRRAERAWALADAHAAIYARFLTHVVQWQNQIYWSRKELSAPGAATTAAKQAAEERIAVLHQASMIPLFELRLIGSIEVVRLGERVLAVVHDLQKRFTEGRLDEPGVAETSAAWVKARDEFIDAVRKEVGVEGAWSDVA